MTTPSTDKPLLDQIKALFAKQPDTPPAKPADKAEPTDTSAALLEVAGQVAGFSNQLAETGKATAKEIAALSDKLATSEKEFAELKAAHDKLLTDFTALAGKLDKAPEDAGQRPPATGGNGNAKPDCL